MTKLKLTNEKINSHGGLSLAGKLIARFCGLGTLFKEPLRARSDRISDAGILTFQIGLLVQGRTHYEDIELFRQDSGARFAQALGLSKIPSEPTLRSRIEALATPVALQKLLRANLALLKAHAPTPLEINGRKYIPNDIKLTPMDNTGSHREHVGRTYKGCDGFAPIMSNLGEEGLPPPPRAASRHPALPEKHPCFFGAQLSAPKNSAPKKAQTRPPHTHTSGCGQ